jgi:putative phosphoesterase
MLREERPDIYPDFIFFNGGTRYCSVFLWPDFHSNMTRQETSKETLRIFVLADTHNRLPETVKEIAKDADEIWHLGDLCIESILDELRAIGPRVTLVRGNCDSNFDWPLVVDLARGGLKFRLQHVPPNQPPNDIAVLLHGHTHVPRNERRGSVLFLNPGCVTRPNRGSPPSVAWLEIVDGKVNWRLVPLR